ncbi:hypothetical protein DFP73DRAFT_198341 [Morchella snyderi]|nr:hypothetical protein DFP73DRAFT_198341 [Morchella snyderi]
MKSQLFSQSSQPQLSPPSPRPLQLLAECSLRDLLHRSHDIRPIPSAERDRVPYYQPYLSQYTRLNYQEFNYGSPEKRKFSQAMDGQGLQPDDFHDQIQQDQHQQQKEVVNILPWTNLASTTKDTSGKQKSGLTTLICAAEPSPEASTITPDLRSSIIPATGKMKQKTTSICSASSSCCDDDDCSSKCEDEDCDAPSCEDCTACEIVPQFCDSESCLEQSSSCPEDASCVQKIICAKDDCEATSCHPLDCVFGNGDVPRFDVPLWSVPLGGFTHQQPQNHNRNQDRNQLQNQHQSSSVEPNLLSLDYNNPDQLQDLQLHYPLPAEQLIHYPISQPNLASEPSESSRSSSAFLEPYNEFSPTFNHDYAAPSKRRRVSQTTPITSPAYEYPSKPSTPFSTTEPVQNWPNYNHTNNENWNSGMLFNTNPASNNLMDLNDCHWDGCNFHFASEVDFQMHLSTHLGELTPEQCLWDACGTSVDGLEDLKEHLAVHLLPPDANSSTGTSPAPTIDDGGPKRCEWLVSTSKNASSSGEEQLVRCGKTFASAEELQKHAKDEHIAILKKKTGHFCGWADCSRRNRPFSQKGKVERHLQTHTGFKSCKCTFCNKEFSAAQALQQHIRTHTGEKPYKCDVCFKEFAQGSALTMHKRVHTGDRPLKCEFPGCGKRFSESSNLSKHRKTHLSVGQHRCGFAGCERTFHRLGTLSLTQF